MDAADTDTNNRLCVYGSKIGHFCSSMLEESQAFYWSRQRVLQMLHTGMQYTESK